MSNGQKTHGHTIRLDTNGPVQTFNSRKPYLKQCTVRSIFPPRAPFPLPHLNLIIFTLYWSSPLGRELHKY